MLPFFLTVGAAGFEPVGFPREFRIHNLGLSTLDSCYNCAKMSNCYEKLPLF